MRGLTCHEVSPTIAEILSEAVPDEGGQSGRQSEAIRGHQRSSEAISSGTCCVDDVTTLDLLGGRETTHVGPRARRIPDERGS